MTKKADQVIDRAADSLRRFADRAATEGGVVSMFAEPLAEDAAFIRKLKPSLIIARAKGQAPTNQPAGSAQPGDIQSDTTRAPLWQILEFDWNRGPEAEAEHEIEEEAREHEAPMGDPGLHEWAASKSMFTAAGATPARIAPTSPPIARAFPRPAPP